jgi:hypothetical protein
MAMSTIDFGKPQRKAVWGATIVLAFAFMTIAVPAQPAASELMGSLTVGVMHSAAQESGFPCGLPGGVTTQSHATISDSGNQTLHCVGDTPVAPDRRIVEEGFPCALHYEGEVTLDSRIMITPGGQVILTCKSRK